MPEILRFNVGDILELKKPHPCGNHRFAVLRIGMDFRLRCDGCGHEIMISRQKAEKGLQQLADETQPQGLEYAVSGKP